MRALSSLLPLRTSADWLQYREAQAIPHRYGETGGTVLQYDGTRRVFVWADHAVLSIDQVRVGGQVVGGWEWSNGRDSSGRTVAFVRFGEAVDEGATIIVRGRGKLDPHAGGLMTNPASVLLDILASIAGNPITRADLDAFRRECDAAGLVIAGSIDDGAVTIQGAVREVCASVGAVFSADAAGLAFLWPGGSTGPARVTLSDGDLAAAATLVDLVTEITVRYDFEAGEPRQTVQLDAPAALARFGRRPQVFDAPWLRTSRNAIALGTRLLQQVARPVWAVDVGAVRRVLRVGDAVQLAHGVLPITGVHRVLGRAAYLAGDVSDIALRVPAGPAPSVRVVRQSSLIEPAQYAAASVQTIAGERVITLTDADGVTPLAGAAVTLNGEITRTTDAAGRVSFPVALMPPGEHTLQITTADGRTLTTTVLVQ